MRSLLNTTGIGIDCVDRESIGAPSSAARCSARPKTEDEDDDEDDYECPAANRQLQTVNCQPLQTSPISGAIIAILINRAPARM
jgi:hypothetical protein